MGIERVQACSC